MLTSTVYFPDVSLYDLIRNVGNKNHGWRMINELNLPVIKIFLPARLISWRLK